MILLQHCQDVVATWMNILEVSPKVLFFAKGMLRNQLIDYANVENTTFHIYLLLLSPTRLKSGIRPSKAIGNESSMAT